MRFLLPAAMLLATASFSAARAADTVSAPPTSTAPQAGKSALPADLEATLRKGGFSDLQIIPNAVFVRGKDKAGNPVAMVLDPRSMTELVTLDPHGGTSGDDRGGTTLTGSSTFATVLAGETLASRLIGTDVSNDNGATLGTIRDIAIDRDGLHAYILRVGGLLGIGERFVAVTPAAIHLGYDAGTRRIRADMKATPEQMRAAPPFDYKVVDQATK